MHGSFATTVACMMVRELINWPPFFFFFSYFLLAQLLKTLPDPPPDYPPEPFTEPKMYTRHLATILLFVSLFGAPQPSESGCVGSSSSGSTDDASYCSTVSGYSNIISSSGYYSTISGGRTNTVTNRESFIGGGRGNTVDGIYSAALAGNKIYVGANKAAVVGGESNRVFAQHAAILGGELNNVSESSQYSAIGGGYNNVVKAPSSTIAGGMDNTIVSSNGLNFIGGGKSNSITDSQYGAIVGGQNNAVLTNFASVVGGYANEAGGRHSVVCGGNLNTASADGAVVVGGGAVITTSYNRDFTGGNLAAGINTFVAGGSFNTATGAHSMCLGSKTSVSHDFSAAMGFAASATCSSISAGSVNVCVDNGMFINGDNVVVNSTLQQSVDRINALETDSVELNSTLQRSVNRINALETDSVELNSTLQQSVDRISAVETQLAAALTAIDSLVRLTSAQNATIISQQQQLDAFAGVASFTSAAPVTSVVACSDSDKDGACDQYDSCPLDSENDADGDMVCGASSVVSTTGSTDLSSDTQQSSDVGAIAGGSTAAFVLVSIVVVVVVVSLKRKTAKLRIVNKNTLDHHEASRRTLREKGTNLFNRACLEVEHLNDLWARIPRDQLVALDTDAGRDLDAEWGRLIQAEVVEALNRHEHATAPILASTALSTLSQLERRTREFFTGRIQLYNKALQPADSPAACAARQLHDQLAQLYAKHYHDVMATEVLSLDDGERVLGHLRTVAGEAQRKCQTETLVMMQRSTRLLDTYWHALALKPVFDEFLYDLANDVHAQPTFPKVKSVFRAFEKASVRFDRQSRFSTADICDIVRGSLEFDSLRLVTRGLQALLARAEFQVIRVKDRFSHPTDAGWRDIVVNGYFNDDQNRHIVEIQLHLASLLPIRRQLGGHVVYSKMRALAEALEVVHGPKWKDVAGMSIPTAHRFEP